MNTQIPVLPRRVALRLLGLAQQAGERGMCALVLADSGIPSRVVPLQTATADAPGNLVPWALAFSALPEPPRPQRDDDRLLRLLVSLGTRGVLQMRGWRWDGDHWNEQPLAVAD